MRLSASYWEQLPYFLAVSRSGSLRGAAEILGTTHAKINRHIQALESAYGMQLVRRTQRGVTLTDAGKTLLPIAEEAETLFLSAQQRLSGLDKQETGSIRFSVAGTLGYSVVAPILAAFFKKYPEIDVEIHVTDQMRDIRKLEADVSLRVAYEVTEDVVARKLFPLSLAYYASPEYLDAHLPSAGSRGEGLHLLGWDEIDRHPFWLKQTPFPLAEVRHATMDHVMQLNLARNGFGIVRTTPLLAADGLTLVPVTGNEPEPERNIYILLHSDLQRTTRVRRFVDFLADGLMQIKPALQGKSTI